MIKLKNINTCLHTCNSTYMIHAVEKTHQHQVQSTKKKKFNEKPMSKKYKYSLAEKGFNKNPLGKIFNQ